MLCLIATLYFVLFIIMYKFFFLAYFAFILCFTTKLFISLCRHVTSVQCAQGLVLTCSLQTSSDWACLASFLSLVCCLARIAVFMPSGKQWAFPFSFSTQIVNQFSKISCFFIGPQLVTAGLCRPFDFRWSLSLSPLHFWPLWFRVRRGSFMTHFFPWVWRYFTTAFYTTAVHA